VAALETISGTQPLLIARRGGLDRRQVALIATLIALGIGIRVLLAFTNYGITYDTDSARIVSGLLAAHPLNAYSTHRWPYPPGFFPLLAATHSLARWTGAHLWALWKLPTALADAGIAATLAWGLGRLGATPRERVVTVALVALGPIFVIVDGYHGQIDAVAILPALAAVIFWQLGGEDRAWKAGLLIGIGTAIKTVPLFMVLALLPTVRSRREAAVLVCCAVCLPLVTLLPWLIAHEHETVKALTFNRGVPGFGGLSVLVQPSLTSSWVHGQLPRASSATWFFTQEQNLVVGVSVLVAGVFAMWRRMDAISAAVLIWLVVFVANFNWAYQYFIWLLPFVLLAGRRREAAALQLVLLLTAAELYFHFGVGSIGWLYIPLMMLVWCALLAATGALAARYRAAPA
jgi:hypothetical protein